MSRPGKIGRLTLRQAAHLYHVLGWSSAQVGEVAGVDYRSVIRAFRRHDIPRRACGRRAKVFPEHIRLARKNGWTKGELAEYLGVAGETTIINAQKRLGVVWPERDRAGK